MRILIFSQYFWPESFPINEVARNLKSVNNSLIVMTGQPNYPDGFIFDGYSGLSLSSEDYEGVTIFRVPVFPRGAGGAVRMALNYLSFIFSGIFFGPWTLRNQSIDCILVYAPSPILQAIPALWLGWLKSAKVIVWVQDLWPESLIETGFIKNKFLIKLVTKLVACIYSCSDLLLAQSKAFIAPIKSLANNTPIIFHPQPGLLEFSRDAKSLPALKFKSVFNVVFAGNLGNVQSLDTVIEAACLLRKQQDIRIVLIGSGSRLGWLREEVIRKGLSNVDTPGRFAANEMPAILAQASVLLVSLSRGEAMSYTLPGKIQTYLAVGKPIIASLDGEGARVIEESGAGIACPAEDSLALANAIIRAYRMPDVELNRMGLLGLEYYEKNFNPRVLVDKMMDILLSVVGRAN